jgi:hypothetical protein
VDVFLWRLWERFLSFVFVLGYFFIYYYGFYKLGSCLLLNYWSKLTNSTYESASSAVSPSIAYIKHGNDPFLVGSTSNNLFFNKLKYAICIFFIVVWVNPHFDTYILDVEIQNLCILCNIYCGIVYVDN